MGISQVQVTLSLFEEAIKNTENVFFHLVSGEDVVLQDFKKIENSWKERYDWGVMMEAAYSSRHAYRARFNHPFANTNAIQSILGKIITKQLKLLDFMFPTQQKYYFGSA